MLLRCFVADPYMLLRCFVVVVVVVEVYLTSHHKQAISPPLIHVDDCFVVDTCTFLC